jgi:hypothetical protein
MQCIASGGIAILDLGTRQRWVVSFMPHLFLRGTGSNKVKLIRECHRVVSMNLKQGTVWGDLSHISISKINSPVSAVFSGPCIVFKSIIGFYILLVEIWTKFVHYFALPGMMYFTPHVHKWWAVSLLWPLHRDPLQSVAYPIAVSPWTYPHLNEV